MKSMVLPVVVSTESVARLHGLDILRVVSAFAIICIHVPETEPFSTWTGWCRFSVPAFTAMSMFLLVLSHARRRGQPVARLVWRQFAKLYTLYLFWNVIYLLARLLKREFVAGGGKIRFTFGSVFLSSFAEHFWCLPFLAWLGVILTVCIVVYLRMNAIVSLAFSLAVFGAGMTALLHWQGLPVDLDVQPSSYFLVLASYTLPAGCAGLLIAWVWLHQRAGRGSLFWCLLLAGSAVFSSSCVRMVSRRQPAIIYPGFFSCSPP